MTTSPSQPRSSSVTARLRAGILAISTLAAVGIAAYFMIIGGKHRGGNRDAVSPELLTTTVWKGPYDLAVTTRGTIESASNVELKCEVRSRSGGTAILEVLPEGTLVEEGDTVIELDSSSLRDEADQQKIIVSARESTLAQAENTLRAAEIAKAEYLEGLYVTQEKQFTSELYIAERAKETAQAALDSTKTLYERAIVSAQQVQSAYAALDDATNKLNSAQTNLDTLRNLTKEKELTLLQASIASGEAEVKSQSRSLRLEQQRLQNIENQIAKCTIKAPAAGQVVYANDPEFFRSSGYTPFVVEPGATVRERQVIVWLPDQNAMQVRVTIPEARVTMVRAGLPVSIRVEALDDKVIEGIVISVSQFPEPSHWSNPVNKYAAIVRINNPPHELRVGMNAETRIHVEQIPDALQLPVQALAESQGRYFSLVKNDEEDFETREIEIGSANDQVATIARGLTEGDEVVINPRSAGEVFKLPGHTDPSAELPITASPAVIHTGGG